MVPTDYEYFESYEEVVDDYFVDEEYVDDDPDWGYNEDMGFDPYLGCYTDDC